METWIALLRGINVGGNHIVPMKELTKLLESEGFTHVKTYIQSGNVVFQSPTKPEDEVGRVIEERFGFKPYVFILSKNELAQAVANNPYKTSEGKTVHFFFCDKVPQDVNYELLDSLKIESEAYMLIDQVLYLHTPDGIGRSKLVEKMGKAFPAVTMTARNLNTINKLMEMVL
ncbi:MAG: DUF1697 domain-containing protein [Bacteroidia bacterium]